MLTTKVSTENLSDLSEKLSTIYNQLTNYYWNCLIDTNKPIELIQTQFQLFKTQFQDLFGSCAETARGFVMPYIILSDYYFASVSWARSNTRERLDAIKCLTQEIISSLNEYISCHPQHPLIPKLYEVYKLSVAILLASIRQALQDPSKNIDNIISQLVEIEELINQSMLSLYKNLDMLDMVAFMLLAYRSIINEFFLIENDTIKFSERILFSVKKIQSLIVEMNYSLVPEEYFYLSICQKMILDSQIPEMNCLQSTLNSRVDNLWDEIKCFKIDQALTDDYIELMIKNLIRYQEKSRQLFLYCTRQEIIFKENLFYIYWRYIRIYTYLSKEKSEISLLNKSLIYHERFIAILNEGNKNNSSSRWKEILKIVHHKYERWIETFIAYLKLLDAKEASFIEDLTSFKKNAQIILDAVNLNIEDLKIFISLSVALKILYLGYDVLESVARKDESHFALFKLNKAEVLTIAKRAKVKANLLEVEISAQDQAQLNWYQTYLELPLNQDIKTAPIREAESNEIKMVEATSSDPEINQAQISNVILSNLSDPEINQTQVSDVMLLDPYERVLKKFEKGIMAAESYYQNQLQGTKWHKATSNFSSIIEDHIDHHFSVSGTTLAPKYLFVYLEYFLLYINSPEEHFLKQDKSRIKSDDDLLKGYLYALSVIDEMLIGAHKKITSENLLTYYEQVQALSSILIYALYLFNQRNDDLHVQLILAKHGEQLISLDDRKENIEIILEKITHLKSGAELAAIQIELLERKKRLIAYNQAIMKVLNKRFEQVAILKDEWLGENVRFKEMHLKLEDAKEWCKAKKDIVKIKACIVRLEKEICLEVEFASPIKKKKPRKKRPGLQSRQKLSSLQMGSKNTLKAPESAMSSVAESSVLTTAESATPEASMVSPSFASSVAEPSVLTTAESATPEASMVSPSSASSVDELSVPTTAESATPEASMVSPSSTSSVDEPPALISSEVASVKEVAVSHAAALHFFPRRQNNVISYYSEQIMEIMRVASDIAAALFEAKVTSELCLLEALEKLNYATGIFNEVSRSYYTDQLVSIRHHLLMLSHQFGVTLSLNQIDDRQFLQRRSQPAFNLYLKLSKIADIHFMSNLEITDFKFKTINYAKAYFYYTNAIDFANMIFAEQCYNPLFAVWYKTTSERHAFCQAILISTTNTAEVHNQGYINTGNNPVYKAL